MKVTDLKWHNHDSGATWTLIGNYIGKYAAGKGRDMFVIRYLGRTQVAFGGGHERWKAYDLRYWVEDQEEHEFKHVHEAKAWVLSIVTLEN